MTDALFIVGIVVALVGVWWIYPPGALIAAGAIMASGAWLIKASERRTGDDGHSR